MRGREVELHPPAFRLPPLARVPRVMRRAVVHDVVVGVFEDEVDRRVE